ncbi:MarR family winged helix-turn-helix transcriptional regulator [Brevibacterium litoralis]|uniref:MarR family winged helix-turn-helix transcriptional regulator n=1 Tax=Brevibacterium litoralis TaxID=3138935 RepID=UPI0032EB43CB
MNTAPDPADPADSAESRLTRETSGRVVPMWDGDGPEPQWLDDAEIRAWRNLMLSHENLVSVLDRELRRAHGLTLQEYEVFVRLAERPDRTMRMADLADSLAVSRSRLTHVVAKMEKNGWVERVSSLDDRRGVDCRMTAAGWDAHVAAVPEHVNGVRRHLIDLLDETEIAVLGRAFAKVNAHLEGETR